MRISSVGTIRSAVTITVSAARARVASESKRKSRADGTITLPCSSAASAWITQTSGLIAGAAIRLSPV